MPKPNYDWDNHDAQGSRLKAPGKDVFLQPRASSLEPRARRGYWTSVVMAAALTGCATPEYAVRPTPVPEESAAALQIERAISTLQAEEFARQRARPLGWDESLWGFEVQWIVERLSRQTERPSLRYRAYLYEDDDPNAAALADGRVYVSTGMLNYLASRGSRQDESLDSASRPRSGRMPSEVEAELAFVLAHELAHTVAQHLLKRYRHIQQQNLLLGLVAAGAAAATGDAGTTAQQAGRLVVDVASLLNDVALSGYSQEQELEADQLGIRYVIRAGFDPTAALALLEDFSRFETPWPFLRTHPYVATRREDLRRYLIDSGVLRFPSGRRPERGRTDGVLAATPVPSGPASGTIADRIKHLRDAQRLYPAGSVSWKNLQQQIEELEGRR